MNQGGWMELGIRHLWHPYTQMLTAPPPIPVERGEGIYLHTSDGRRILDGISSWWVNIHGHSHPRLNQALRLQSERLEQVIFAGFSHEPAARLAAELVERAPENLTRAFFSDDGSTAVEVALKMAYQYWRNRGCDTRTQFVALQHAYHGDTFGAMATGGGAAFHTTFRELFFTVHHADSAYCFKCPVGLTRAECSIDCLHSLETILQENGDRIAAVIIEPMVQAAGGMIIWPAEFLQGVERLTSQFKIPLICDEVFTGFGRTGRMFALEHGPIKPDLVCLSKGLTAGYLPLSVTLASERIYESFLSKDRSRTFFHGHSFTANPLACAVARESLQMFDEEDRLERVNQLERLFRLRLELLAGLRVVGEVRSIGAIAAIELCPQDSGGYFDSLGPFLNEAFLRRDILLRPLGNVLYFLPPYVISDSEVHFVFDAIEEVLKEVS